MRTTLRAAVLAAAAALATAPLPAAADDSPTALPPGCDAGSICGYTGYGFAGDLVPLQAGAGCVNLKTPIRSIANTYGSPGIPAAAGVYSGPDCTGDLVATAGQEQSVPRIVPDGASVSLAW
ncbi:hypothetical protein [Streptomonospora wellingtoniae]|uniref:Peptidase inhibitor family I36 protein n=1 Tax=Streptomonospora wellingtoniae TaxID=3075544 RepID=A0ABU2KZI2_9ACTN|nr:hypothetical protein [Streptomonospora sp. DSM 45055]MDT0304418.1 hypothetical protein [Streptomonospora sp. DSM 45055]